MVGVTTRNILRLAAARRDTGSGALVSTLFSVGVKEAPVCRFEKPASDEDGHGHSEDVPEACVGFDGITEYHSVRGLDEIVRCPHHAETAAPTATLDNRDMPPQSNDPTAKTEPEL